MIASTAERARQTATIAAAGSEIAHHQSLYLGGLAPLKEIVSAFEDPVEIVWAVGHNPAFSATASALSGVDVRLATANAACLTIEAPSWEEAIDLAGVWELSTLLTPH